MSFEIRVPRWPISHPEYLTEISITTAVSHHRSNSTAPAETCAETLGVDLSECCSCKIVVKSAWGVVLGVMVPSTRSNIC